MQSKEDWGCCAGSYKNSNDKIEIVATYNNADVNKELALKENRGKSGIYRWINIETGESYVGSSANLSKRFNQYFNYSHIANTKRNMRIDRALLKYGYSKFKLEILEYCKISNLIEREQYYLDLLKPEYNILLKAGSSLGFKHTEKTKLLMKTKTPEHLVKLKKNIAKLNASPFPADVRAKITAGMVKFNVLTKSKKVVFTNIETNERLIFNSFRDASLNMKISRNTIKKYIISKEIYGKYKISLI